LKNSLKETSVKIYATCEEMPLWNFHKYYETNDLKYFTENLLEIEGLELVKKTFLEEYYSLSKNEKVSNKLAVADKIMILANKFESVNFIIWSIKNFETALGRDALMELVSDLQKWNYNIKSDRNLIDQVNAIESRLEGIKTKIRLLESEIEEEQEEKETSSLESQILSVTRVLNLPYKIDSKKTSVLEWIEMQEQCRILAEAQKQQNTKNNVKRN